MLLSISSGTGCGQNAIEGAGKSASTNPESNRKPPATVQGNLVSTRFSCPDGYTRMQHDSGSFAYFLGHFPLKPHGTPVRFYDGNIKEHAAHAAVMELSTGKEDLQQCADAVMRLRSEYLYSRKEYSLMHFNFVSGFRCGFDRWMQGCRVKMNGNQSSWACTQTPDAGRSSFDAWLSQVFMFAGTASLEKELRPVPASEVMPGDVWIKGGSPGHAVIVMDVCTDSSGNRLFMLAQSYMPAQDMHILRNYEEADISPWFRVPLARSELITPEWTFAYNQLRRF
ncbi:MAG: hypothetical protein KJS92_03160 [Bacteroidetes bacterium]|nr:hypothetical protein [Bacteroidota bacterium]